MLEDTPQNTCKNPVKRLARAEKYIVNGRPSRHTVAISGAKAAEVPLPQLARFARSYMPGARAEV